MTGTLYPPVPGTIVIPKSARVLPTSAPWHCAYALRGYVKGRDTASRDPQLLAIIAALGRPEHVYAVPLRDLTVTWAHIGIFCDPAVRLDGEPIVPKWLATRYDGLRPDETWPGIRVEPLFVPITALYIGDARFAPEADLLLRYAGYFYPIVLTGSSSLQVDVPPVYHKGKRLYRRLARDMVHRAGYRGSLRSELAALMKQHIGGAEKRWKWMLGLAQSEPHHLFRYPGLEDVPAGYRTLRPGALLDNAPRLVDVKSGCITAAEQRLHNELMRRTRIADRLPLQQELDL